MQMRQNCIQSRDGSIAVVKVVGSQLLSPAKQPKKEKKKKDERKEKKERLKKLPYEDLDKE